MVERTRLYTRRNRQPRSKRSRLVADVDPEVAALAKEKARQQGESLGPWLSNIIKTISASFPEGSHLVSGGRLEIGIRSPLDAESARDLISEAKHNVVISGMTTPLLLTDPKLQDLARTQISQGISWHVLTLHPKLRTSDSGFRFLKDNPYKFPKDGIEKTIEVHDFLHELIRNSGAQAKVTRCGSRVPLSHELIFLDSDCGDPTVYLEVPLRHKLVLVIQAHGTIEEIAPFINPMQAVRSEEIVGTYIESSRNLR